VIIRISGITNKAIMPMDNAEAPEATIEAPVKAEVAPAAVPTAA